MKRYLFIFAFSLWTTIQAMAISMKVGDTQTLSIGNISYLQGCQWEISRPNDVVFATTPQSYSTQVTIKAVHAFSSVTPCIVSCKYYYLDLDPTTGRYTYLRTGYKDWTIFVSNDGSGGSGGDNDNSLSLNVNSITTYVDEWSDYITAYTSSNSELSWQINDLSIAGYMKSAARENSILVWGNSVGETYVTVSQNSKYATCKIKVLPKRNYQDGDVFIASTKENVRLAYKIISVSDGTCQVGTGSEYSYDGFDLDDVDYNKTEVTIPEYVNGFKVISINDGAFNYASWIKKITLPNSLTKIGTKAFQFCESLTEINIPNGISKIEDSTFANCENLKSIVLPNSITSIEQGAFYRCTSLSSISFSSNLENIGNWAFSQCILEVVDLPKSIHSLGSIVFNKCTSVKTIFLRNNILTNNEHAFEDCSSVESIIITETEPLRLNINNFHSNTITKATLYIPYGTKVVYKNTEGWREFHKIMEIGKENNDYEINLSSSGYATFYSSEFAYILPKDLTAQVVTSAANCKLNYKTIADGSISGVIPAGVAVMLTNDNKQGGTYTLATSENAASYTGTNLLRGSDVATTTTGDGYHYKLSYGPTGTQWSNVFGWYWGTQNGSAFQIEGHKAWLVVPMSGGTRGYSINGEAMGIETICSDAPAADNWYDLQGRRISQTAKKGLYIRNGKKYINK